MTKGVESSGGNCVWYSQHDTHYPLHDAVKEGIFDTVFNLISQGWKPTQPNCTGETPLTLAVDREDLGILGVILNSLSMDDINASKIVDRAIMERKAKVVGQLLKHPYIPINAPNASGSIPLHLAVAAESPAIVRALLACESVIVNAPDNEGATPLHWTVFSPNIECVQLLTNDPRIDVNAQNKGGSTPLHLAAAFGILDVVNTLLTHSSIDLTIRNWYNLTPLELAEKAKKTEVVTALKAHMKMHAPIETKDLSYKGKATS